MTPESAPQVAAIHRAALPDDFLPALGARFLARTYYAAQPANPHARVLTAVESGKVIGFVQAAWDADRCIPWLVRRHPWRVVLAVLTAGVLSPARLLEAWRLARRPTPHPAGAGEIAFIAVAPDHRGQGVGVALVRAAHEEFRQHGVGVAFTKTLANNEGAVALYERHFGARIESRFAIGRNRYVTLVWQVGSDAGAAEP